MILLQNFLIFFIKNSYSAHPKKIECIRNVPDIYPNFFSLVVRTPCINYVSLRTNENWNRPLFLRNCNRMQVDYTRSLQATTTAAQLILVSTSSYIYLSLAFCEFRINSISMPNWVSRPISGCLSCMRKFVHFLHFQLKIYPDETFLIVSTRFLFRYLL